eukprot:4591689-Prymnesium_polylepis.1
MQEKIEEFQMKEWAEFDENYAELLSEEAESRKQRTKATEHFHAAQMRMAVKHGYVRIVRGSRSTSVDAAAPTAAGSGE